MSKTQIILRSLLERADEKNANGFPVIIRKEIKNSMTTYIRFDAVAKAFNLTERGFFNEAIKPSKAR